MDLLQIISLALLQGITEFLPVSSSAHLILPSELLGWPDQGLAFDVAVHLGTLTAVITYFRKDIALLLTSWFGQFAGKGSDEHSRLGWFIIAATIPAGLAGLLFKDFIAIYLREAWIIGVTTLVFGGFLWWADRGNQGTKNIAQITLKTAIIIGCAQAIALIPGTSRSGITITAALFLGFSRQDSARFSFLISIPIIVLSAALIGLDLIASKSVDWFAMIIGTIVSGVSAYLCIYYFLAFINRLGMLPFVIYRFFLGVVLLWVTLGGFI